MGETANQPFQLSFNPALKVEFQGSRVTSDGGLILVRELDQRLGFSDLIAQHITDPRGKNTQFPPYTQSRRTRRHIFRHGPSLRSVATNGPANMWPPR